MSIVDGISTNSQTSLLVREVMFLIFEKEEAYANELIRKVIEEHCKYVPAEKLPYPQDKLNGYRFRSIDYQLLPAGQKGYGVPKYFRPSFAQPVRDAANATAVYIQKARAEAGQIQCYMAAMVHLLASQATLSRANLSKFLPPTLLSHIKESYLNPQDIPLDENLVTELKSKYQAEVNVLSMRLATNLIL